MKNIQAFFNSYDHLRLGSRAVLYIVLSCLALTGKAQVSVQLQPIMPVQLRLTDMWRANVMNSSGEEINAYLKGSVSYGNTTLIVEGTSQPLVLKPGINVINPASISIRGYEFNPAVNLPNLSSTELFPFGSYVICLKVYNANSSELGASCIEAIIKPLSPPMLLSPYNEAQVHTAYPLLIWSPPTPVPSGMQVQYDLKLVEVLSGQNPADAIQRNFALIQENDLHSNLFQYPVNAVKLEPQKHYAWQVVAKGDNFLIGTTEVWSFKMVLDTMNAYKLPNPEQFYEPKIALDGAYAVAVEVLGVILKEADNFKLTLYNSKHELLKVKPELKRIANDSRHIVNLKETGKLQNGEVYMLEFISSTGEKTYILFKYFSSIKKYKNTSSK
ncbi:MAG: hypothetical protein KBE37_05790 [Bacteroidia bacterium]|nr:hypothetical protein [Bacteroidia bacterium]MBP9724300.1 hypothetical protein [Bacteroidia bacterium]